jgi:hypothetical protein
LIRRAIWQAGGFTAQKPIRRDDESKLIQHMRRLQRQPEKVRSFFFAADVVYAA